jgi:hypothetical protein
MHVHDAHSVALLPVRWRNEQAPDQANRRERSAGGGEPRQYRTGQAQEAPRVGETVQRATLFRSALGRCGGGGFHGVTLSHNDPGLKRPIRYDGGAVQYKSP